MWTDSSLCLLDLAGSEEVRFGIETKRSDSRTNVIDFGELIQDSMRLMRELCEKVKKHEQVREEDRVNGLISKLSRRKERCVWMENGFWRGV